MSQPKEVHCPFCHHKEMFDGPVGSTVRCRNCKSIFRLPAEGVKHGEKVKKYKVRRHSPVYYVVVVILIAGGVLGYLWVKQVIEQRQKRLAEIWTKLDDPFIGKVPDKAESAEGVLERFMECWKQGNAKSEETGDYTGYECMLLYVTPEDLQDKKLEDMVKEFKGRFGANEVKGYRLAARPNARDQSSWEIKVALDAQSTEGLLTKHGELTAVVTMVKNQRAAEGKHIRENGPITPETPPIEPKDGWAFSVSRSMLGWD